MTRPAVELPEPTSAWVGYASRPPRSSGPPGPERHAAALGVVWAAKAFRRSPKAAQFVELCAALDSFDGVLG